MKKTTETISTQTVNTKNNTYNVVIAQEIDSNNFMACIQNNESEIVGYYHVSLTKFDYTVLTSWHNGYATISEEDKTIVCDYTLSKCRLFAKW